MLKNDRNMWLRWSSDLSIMLIFFLLFSGIINAQGGFGDRTGGGGENKNNSIRGRVNLPSNQPAVRFKIRLESSGSATLMTFSNTEGNFYFNSLYPGYYTIIVEAGDEYVPARESLVIERESIIGGSRSYSVMIDLRERRNVKNKPGVINASLAKVPKSALEEFNNALEAINKGDEKSAVENLTEAVRLYPQFAEAYSELGTLYLKNGEMNKAEDALLRTLQLNERNPTAQLNYGIVLLNQRKMFEAEKQLEKAVLADENAATPHMYLGIALLGLNYPDYAEKEFLKAISLKDDEKTAQAHKYLGGIYWKKKKYKQAIEELQKYIELDPKAPDAEKVRSTIKQLREKSK